MRTTIDAIASSHGSGDAGAFGPRNNLFGGVGGGFAAAHPTKWGNNRSNWRHAIALSPDGEHCALAHDAAQTVWEPPLSTEVDGSYASE